MDHFQIGRTVRLWLFCLLGVLLGGGCSVAFAQYSGSASPPDIRLRGPNSLPFDYSAGKYVGFGPGSSGGATLDSSYGGRLGGALVPISGSRVIPGSALARIGMGLAKLSGPVGLGMTLAPLIWDEAAQMWKKEEPPPSGTEPQGLFRNNVCSVVRSTPRDACLATNACAGSAWPGTYVWGGQVNTFVQCHRADGSLHPTAVTASVVCPTGHTWNGSTCVAPETVPPRPATDAEIQDAIYVELVARGFGSELARRLVEAGYEPDVLAEAGPQNLSGPASVDGPSSTSTTTGPAGQTTVISNTTYNITYQGDTVTVTETTTTTTTNPDNSTQTSTETKSPTTDAPAEVPPSEPPQTDCDKYPRASGCEELGDPQDEELQEQTETVSWAAEGGAAGSCPAPEQWTTHGQTYLIEWTPICNFATGIRPFVIGIAWLGAGLFIFMVAKEKA